jgi:hypothetical protein
MSWLSLGSRKRKREESVLDTVTRDIERVVGNWRDGSGLGYSVDMSRVIGEDFANITLHGLDTLNCADIVALACLENVSDFVCDLERSTLVVRVERRNERCVKISC